MSKISSFMLCMNVDSPQVAGRPMILVNPVVALRPKYVPGQYTFGICATITEVDMGRDNFLRFEINAPDGTIVLSAEPFTLPKKLFPPDANLKAEGIIFSTTAENCEIPVEGDYILRIFINDEPGIEHNFPVYKAV